MNSKNLLQEYCQRNNYPLPEYQTRSAGNDFFISTVLVCGNAAYTGDPASRKKDAEMNAATKAYQSICAENLEKKSSFQGSEKLGIFIDLENKQKIYDELDQHFHLDKSKFDIHIFITKNHVLAQKEFPYASKHLVDSMMKDAVDTYLIFMLGKLADKYEDFIIVTGDHYAKVMEEILIKEGKKARMCTNIKDIIGIIGD